MHEKYKENNVVKNKELLCKIECNFKNSGEGNSVCMQLTVGEDDE